ncbi:UDP-N-acetylmuramoyl-tripeptide--D-alanyl-D-alanine ligase [Paraferrimonas haliotis]|uniref:UDP-N-acetylmuramoyl-tripeptide--D-alanyl-D-alanine ligase n=1 Tax=Paraferrimonas haliotis TaxID=2013866 RepID=A0AA37TS74_9GAMM|nr:UDP-N-acetylmuramoyl-tripeptide--D-alanyl-D-alanine ligase [Paraferrimonas haliotis]GLS82194.1 UDP-N-acetylmuramoyl-tripeptide--D-alanyl-D-alanine ligase [Paraferrimonas haliotis]
MIPLSLQSIAHACDGHLVGDDAKVTHVTTNSSQVTRGSLFVALIGDRFDAHEFAEQACKQGAVALMVSRQLDLDVAQVVVQDTRIGLGQLGALVKQRVAPSTLAITGSNGKTTVKEMLTTLLSRHYSTLATKGNFNNEIGVPLTLLELEEQHQMAVVELGANHIGEIRYTASLAQPDVALVNNIGDAHLEGFGSRDGIAQAKSEIYQSLGPQGIAVINLDDDYADTMLSLCIDNPMIVYSATNTDADVFASDITTDELGCMSFNLHHGEQRCLVHLPLPGEHQVANALAATAMALAVQLPLPQIAQALNELQAVPGRMELHKLQHHVIVDDSYNANPASVKAAIDWLAKNSASSCLVLGDLAELGDNSPLLHRELGEYAKASQIQHVVSLGPLSQCAADAADGMSFTDIGSLNQHLTELVANSSEPITLLVKGSRSAKMERVVSHLLNAFNQEEHQ